MALTAVLFDLDGTLLPMDQDVFIKAYFSGIAANLAPLGYEPKVLLDTIWGGTIAMIKNSGEKTNEAVFWDYFTSIYGEDARKDEPQFETFYRTEFQKVRAICGFDPNAAKTVRSLKEKGIRVILATNPIFPAIATESRIRWAGLEPKDFELITTYENIGRSKPYPAYYEEILRRQNLRAEECLMVGNDVRDDMSAEKLGMQVFLLTDNLINKADVDISRFPHGGFAQLQALLERLIPLA